MIGGVLRAMQEAKLARAYQAANRAQAEECELASLRKEYFGKMPPDEFRRVNGRWFAVVNGKSAVTLVPRNG
jgi:hypothetical protein